MIQTHIDALCGEKYAPDGPAGMRLAVEVARLVLAEYDGRPVAPLEWQALADRMHPDGLGGRRCQGFMSNLYANASAFQATMTTPKGVAAVRQLVAANSKDGGK